MRAALFALALTLWGCHAPTSAAPAGTAYYCGAICGTNVVVLDATSSAEGLRFFVGSPAGEYPALSFSAALPGTTLEAITYAVSNGTAATTLVVEASTGGVVWTQAAAANADVGSFSLALSDAGGAVAIDGGTRWPTPQGVLTATLEPQGTVTDAGLAIVVPFPTASVACPSACMVCFSPTNPGPCLSYLSD